jgi:hypothetical protein
MIKRVKEPVLAPVPEDWTHTFWADVEWLGKVYETYSGEKVSLKEPNVRFPVNVVLETGKQVTKFCRISFIGKKVGRHIQVTIKEF